MLDGVGFEFFPDVFPIKIVTYHDDRRTLSLLTVFWRMLEMRMSGIHLTKLRASFIARMRFTI